MPHQRDQLKFIDFRSHHAGFVAYISRHVTARPSCIPRHVLPNPELLVVIKGRCAVTVDGAPHIVSGGQALLLPAQAELVSQEMHLRGMCYWLGLRAMRDLTGAAPLSLLEQWSQWQQRFLLSPLPVSGDLHQACEALWRHGEVTDLTWSWWHRQNAVLAACMEVKNPDQDQRLVAVMTFMRQHLCENHSTEDLASRCGMSVSSFRRLFRDSFGQTPQSWLYDERLRCAEKELSGRASANVETVALALGFHSRRHFIDVCRRLRAVHPEEWQQRETR